MKRALIFACVVALVAVGQDYSRGVYGPVIRDAGLPDVLIIGDSISIGYTPYVRDEMDGIANVHRVPQNSERTIDSLDWLGQGWISPTRDYSVITFNFGLHDARVPPASPYTPLADYDDNLELIIQRLHRMQPKAKLLWVTTTDVLAGTPDRTEVNCQLYETAAQGVLAGHPEVGQIDLHTLSAANPSWHLTSTDVHFNSTGYAGLGAAVATAIAAEL